MSTRNRSFALPAIVMMLVGGLLLAACGGSDSDADDKGGSAAPAALPARSGSYGVGHSTVTIRDSANTKDITVDIWYPIVAGTTGTAARYALLPIAYVDSKVAIEGAPIATDGPYPLAIYSHGSGGQRYVASYLTEDIASHGYVVLSADHAGDTATDRLTGATVTQDQNDANRPAVVTSEIDWALAQSKTDGALLKGAIDANRIGLVGHSYGGYTVLAEVGGHTGPGGTVTADTRVKAVVGMAPYTRRLSDAELAAIKVPVLLMVGTKDTTTPSDLDDARPFKTISGRPLVLATLKDAAHQSFTDVCMYQEEIPKLGTVPAVVTAVIEAQAAEGCGPEYMPYARDLELSSSLTIAFLDEFVAGDAQAKWFEGDVAVLSTPDLTLVAAG